MFKTIIYHINKIIIGAFKMCMKSQTMSICVLLIKLCYVQQGSNKAVSKGVQRQQGREANKAVCKSEAVASSSKAGREQLGREQMKALGRGQKCQNGTRP
jgi:hypothetical protein